MHLNLKQAQQNEFSKEINAVYKALIDIDPKTYPSIPENVFVKLFLPLFVGEATENEEVSISMWTKNAGNLFTPVNVIGGRGEILFTVPPIVNRDAIMPFTGAPDGMRVTSMMNVAASYSQYMMQNPALAEQFIDAELTKRALVMSNPPSALKDLETWNEIFVRYGRPPIRLPSNAKEAAKNEQKPSDDDYDFTTL
jgi:hypothetical protein